MQATELLERVAELADYSVVGPHDSRWHEIETRKFPFNTICHLGRDFGDGKLRGCTGTLISPTVVLTAAHCLWNHRLRRAPRSIRVSPGRRDRDTFPFGSIVASRYYAPEGFISGPPGTRNQFDFGIIILPKPFARITAFMPTAALSDAALSKLKDAALVTVAGYPGDRPIGSMWRHAERLRSIEPARLRYTVDTCPGHSGSAIWTVLNGRRTIIGVHTSGIVDEQGRSFGCNPGTVLAPTGRSNSGVRLNPTVRDAVLRPTATRSGPRAMRRLP